MIDTKDLTVRNTTDYYTSFELPKGHVLFVAHTKKKGKDMTLACKMKTFASTFSCAMVAGREMIRKGEINKFTIQTVDVAKDEPDTGMLILMTQ